MTPRKIAGLIALALPLALAACSHPQPIVYAPPPPPPAFSPAAQQGYQNGVEAARRGSLRAFPHPTCSVTLGSATRPCPLQHLRSTGTASAPATIKLSAAVHHPRLRDTDPIASARLEVLSGRSLAFLVLVMLIPW